MSPLHMLPDAKLPAHSRAILELLWMYSSSATRYRRGIMTTSPQSPDPVLRFEIYSDYI